MNLKDNLRKIRKDNNLSQEDLAEKLGVSRQSVSKWESGSAYPEMDKVIQLCNMFNLNIDDLLNQDIKKVEKTKQSKVDVGKYIDDFLLFFNKTINMFSSMKFKEKVKCLFEQAVIFLMFLLIFVLIGQLLNNIFGSLINMLPDEAYNIVYNIFDSLYSTAAIILGIILMVQIFKTRYLNYYTILDKSDEVEESTEADKENIATKTIFNNKQERIIIRDPKHSEYRFIKGMLKLILFFIKMFTVFFALFFCASFVFFVVCFVLSFLFVKTGLLFIGAIISFAAAIILNYSILNVAYNFVVNKKINKIFIGILLVVSLVLGGIGIGLSLIGVKDFEYIDEPSDKYLVITEQNIKMNSKLFFDDMYYDVKYIESDIKDIKVETKYVKNYEIVVEKRLDDFYEVHRNYSDNEINSIKTIIRGINNKEIINYSYYEVNIYASKKNIEILKNNRNQYVHDEY